MAFEWLLFLCNPHTQFRNRLGFKLSVCEHVLTYSIAMSSTCATCSCCVPLIFVFSNNLSSKRTGSSFQVTIIEMFAI